MRLPMRIGIACPYTWDVPGGVQAHVADLARSLLTRGHQVQVLAPADDDVALPPFAVPAGRAVPIPYNGSVARMAFGPRAMTRTRRWLREGGFDVLHVHEPAVPSVSLLACLAAEGPIVATFHTAMTRSRVLQVFGSALQPALEKITGRIAVSDAARRVVVEHLGGDAVLIPNGVDVARFAAAARPVRDDAASVLFLGRMDEPRKGLAVLLEALPELVRRRPEVTVLVGGPGDARDVRDAVPRSLQPNVRLLGLVPEAAKAAVFAAADVYCAPNTHGESFGIVLVEAMAAGTPVVASDLPAFRAVLHGGRAGVLTPVGDPAALAAALAELLADVPRRAALAAAGRTAVRAYDWSTVTTRVLEVYETAVAAAPAPVHVDDDLDTIADEPADGPTGAADAEQDDASRMTAVLRRWMALRSTRTPS